MKIQCFIHSLCIVTFVMAKVIIWLNLFWQKNKIKSPPLSLQKIFYEKTN